MGIEYHSCKTSIGVLTDFKSFKVKSACFESVRTRAPLGYRVVMMVGYCFLHFIPKAWYQQLSPINPPKTLLFTTDVEMLTINDLLQSIINPTGYCCR